MNKFKISNRRLIILGLMAFILVVALWAVLDYIQVGNYKYEYSIEDHWTVYVNGEMIAQDATLTDVNFGSQKRLTTYDLYAPIPEEIGSGYTAEILVYLCSVEAYVDDVKLYDYASDVVDRNIMIGSGYHFIPLGDNPGGKTLWIHLVMNEDNACTSITTPRISRADDAITVFAGSQAVNTVIGVFLLGLGFVLFFVGLLATIVNPIYARLIFIGLFSNLMGSWSILSNKIAQIYSLDRTRNTSLEYFALYWAPVVFGIIMWLMRKDDSTWRKKIIMAITTMMTLFAAVAMVLHHGNIIRFPHILPYFHIMGGICIVGLAIAGFISVEDKNRSEIVTTLAVIMLIALIGLDLVRFNIQKYLFPNLELLLNSFIPLASLCFVVMLLISYLLYLYDMVMTKAEKEMLTQLAYHDVLTGLWNRTKFEEDVKDIDASDRDFAVIDFDVNGLKMVNDTFGHSEGDILIKSFAQVLQEEFDAIGTCYRMGGDEFLVVVDENYFNSIDSALNKMVMAQKQASLGHEYDIDASYGIAYKKEVPGGAIERVYSEADRKMYEMKVRAHNSRTYQNMNLVPKWKV